MKELLDPSRKKQTFSYRMQPWIVSWLEKRKEETGKSIGLQIEEAILNYYEINPPKARRLR